MNLRGSIEERVATLEKLVEWQSVRISYLSGRVEHLEDKLEEVAQGSHPQPASIADDTHSMGDKA